MSVLFFVLACTGAGDTDPGDTDLGDAGLAGDTDAAEGAFFPAGNPWSADASAAPVDPSSAEITAWMAAHSPPNGWGTGTFRVDFSIVPVTAAAGTPKRAYTAEPDYYYQPDCDFAPVPLPAGGRVEGGPASFSGDDGGYECLDYDSGADCHLVVHAPSEHRLYEVYHATVRGGEFRGGCLAIWDTSRVYPATGRGDQCTSADAAGFPILPLLFTADEIAAGRIDHAIRFTLPNDMIRQRQYVRPATHGTNTSGPATSIPYGAHLRLRADYPLDTLSPPAQVVARALQKYGMFHADGGNIALTAASDALTTAKWAEVGFDTRSLAALKATDFEVLDAGPTIEVTFDCRRTPINE